jgi:DNA-binding transcriptional LysR family regulator
MSSTRGAHVDDDDIQLPYLTTFTTVAETGSFTAAGRELGVTQAAVSQRVHTLEKRLNTALFQRQSGGVLLTEAGQKLHSFAERILSLHRAAEAELAGRKAPVAGQLTIGASSVPGENLLPLILSDFRRQFPVIQVRVRVSDSMEVMRQIESGRVAIGLVGRKIENARLEFRAIARDRMVFAVRQGHRWTKRKRIKLGELCSEPIILREEGSGLRHCFERALEKVGKSIGDLKISLELGSNEAIKEAVLRGGGVAVLSEHAVRRELDSGRLRAVEVTGLECEREIFVVRDRRRVLSGPARAFQFFLETHPFQTRS